MKKSFFITITTLILLLMPMMIFPQAPSLGTVAGFVLFSSTGAVTNTGISQITGNVGTNGGSSTGFGNVNGVMHDNDGASAQCAADLLIAYNQLNSTVANYFPAPLLGNGQILTPGVYSISAATTLNLSLTLNAQGNSNAVFIFKIQGTLSAGANSKIILVNGAQACNVFWKVEGMVSLASGTTMRGTIIANNAAIMMNTGDTLEGRALSTAGAVTLDGVMAYTPVGCGSPTLTGPLAPNLASTACYALFSSNGAVANSGVTHITGDVGTNVGLTTGFDPLLVTGEIHPIPDGSTAQCAADLLVVYNHLNLLPVDIVLMFPAQFGNNLVLTPHTYLLDAATTLTGSLYLNAMGNADAVFVIKINGALSTSSHSTVILTNGAQAKNIYWKIEGAVNLSSYSVFKGTIVCNNGAVGALDTGVNLDGRALTTTGALSTSSVTVTIPSPCCIVPEYLHVSGIVGQGEVSCENALHTITVAGSGSSYLVQNGGSATLIAGQKIRLLVGTHVFHGGYLHAYITHNGTYCCSIPGNKSTEITHIPDVTQPPEGIRIYPNPNQGSFVLETNGQSGEIKTMVCIYDMTGKLILQEELPDRENHTISLNGHSRGIYFLRLSSGSRIETGKIVLN